MRMSSEHQQKMEKRGEGTLAIIMLALIQGRVLGSPSFTDISNVLSFHLLVLLTVVMTLDV